MAFPNRHFREGPSTIAEVEVMHEGSVVEHECGMPLCVHPEHLKVSGSTVLLVTETADNEGLSVTNNAEAVVEWARREYGPWAVVVEHYDATSYPWGRRGPDTFSLVTIGDGGHADWRYLGCTQEEALEALNRDGVLR